MAQNRPALNITMASVTNPNKNSSTEHIEMVDLEQAPTNPGSNIPAQPQPASPDSTFPKTNRHRELLLVAQLTKNQYGNDHGPATSSPDEARPANTSTATSPVHLNHQGWALRSHPFFSSRVAARPDIPTIRVKDIDTGEFRDNAGGSVSPATHTQSPHHLRVIDNRQRERRPDPHHRVTIEADEPRTFWDHVDRALGLRQVRTFGDGAGDRRLAAKRAMFRAILVFGVAMMISLLVSSVLFVVFGSRGTQMSPAWFVWMGVSGGGLIWSVLAFIMASRQKNKAKFDEEIARQAKAINARVRGNNSVLGGVVGGPANNEKKVQRATAAAPVVSSVLPVPTHRPGV